MISDPISKFSTIYSLSPDSKHYSMAFSLPKPNFSKRNQGLNHSLKLPCNSEDVFGDCFDLNFGLKTLVPTNTPNIISPKKQAFEFQKCEEMKSKSAEIPSQSVKDTLLAKIQEMKRNLANENPPNYLKSLISRGYIVEKVSKSPVQTVKSPELKVPVQSKQPEQTLQRQAEDPKKLEIKKTINKWTSHFKNQREGNSDIEFQNEIRNCLNKLTPDNYEIIRTECLENIKGSQKKCDFLVKKIIEKAWNEPKYTKVYAELCAFLQAAKELDVEESGKTRKRKNMFKTALLGSIQSAFEDGDAGDSEEKMDSSAKFKKKKRIIGIVKFIGELFIIRILPEIIVQLCATTMLLKTYEEYINNTVLTSQCENNLEGLIVLYDKVGKPLDSKEEKGKKPSSNDKNAAYLALQIKKSFINFNQIQVQDGTILSFEQIMEILTFMRNKLEISKRHKILIQNLMDRRKRNWKESISSSEVPMKISELHEMEVNSKAVQSKRIIITSNLSLELSEIKLQSSFLSYETKSTESGTPKSTGNSIKEAESRIKSSLSKFKSNPSAYTIERVKTKMQKLLMRNEKKKDDILGKFLQNFYNDVSNNVQKLVGIPFALYQEKIIEKQDFIRAFNQSIEKLSGEIEDNPKLVEYMAIIFMDFAKNKVCEYEEIEFNEEIANDDELMRNFLENFKKRSLDLLDSNKLAGDVVGFVRKSLGRMKII